MTGESLTLWRRYVWIQREKLYLDEVGARQQRERDEMEARIRPYNG